jgi:hypothetical protein
MDSSVFWVVRPCSSEKGRLFGETYFLSLQRINYQKQAVSSYFDPKDGGSTSLRNVGLSPNYMVLKPTRPYSSINILLTGIYSNKMS